MSLQSIINISNGLDINRRKVVGIQYARNEIPRINITPTLNPWRFTVAVPNSLRYSDARTIMETIDTLDRAGPETISFSSNPKLSWIFRYQGAATTTQLNGIRVQSFIGNQLVLTNLPTINFARTLFAPNDLIMIGTNPYPFTSTTEIKRGINASVTITTNRPNILTSPVVNSAITVGNTCKFRMFCPNMPTYKLIPGGSVYDASGTLINNAYIEWSTDFNLYEYLGEV